MEIERILVSVGPGETRIVALSQGQLVGLTFERNGQRNMVGDILVGRVEAVQKNLQAAFVDIGAEASGFLGLADARPYTAKPKDTIEDYVLEGDLILVQVTRNPEENKGAKLTLKPILTSRNLVFIPDKPGVSVSRRITDSVERDRLVNTLASQNITSGGFIFRTAAVSSGSEILRTEAEQLKAAWFKIQSDFKTARSSKVLMREIPPAQRILRDSNVSNLNAVLTDDVDTYDQLKAYTKAEMSNISSLVHLHQRKGSLFHSEGIEEMIEATLEPLVTLPNGGNIKITETDALVAVDVNTGSVKVSGRDQMIKSVNCEAAEVLAKHMVLRNLSGLIIIDFITMRNAKHRKDVLDTLRRAVADDPQQPFVGGFTRFGLVEMTRRRTGVSLSTLLCGKLQTPEKNLVTTGLEALRLLLLEASAAPTSHLILKISKELHHIYERDLTTALAEVQDKIGGRLKLECSETIRPKSYAIISKLGSQND